MVFLLSNRFGMVLVAVVIAVDATLNMLAVDDVAEPPSNNDDDSAVRSTLVRRWSMVLSRTRVPTMGSVIDAESGFVGPLLLVSVSRGRFRLLLWLVFVGNVMDDRIMDGEAGPTTLIWIISIFLVSKFILFSVYCRVFIVLYSQFCFR